MIKECKICGIQSGALHMHMKTHNQNNMEKTANDPIVIGETLKNDINSTLTNNPVFQGSFDAPKSEMVQVSKEQLDGIMNKIKMLEAVADKGRVFNYENSNIQKKPLKIKIAIFQKKYIIGWQTVKDISVYHPTTGKQVGEQQEYELLLLDSEGKESKVSLNGYPAFSDARYAERVECEVYGKKEGYDGNIDFEVVLPDGRKITINSRFAN